MLSNFGSSTTKHDGCARKSNTPPASTAHVTAIRIAEALQYRAYEGRRAV